MPPRCPGSLQRHMGPSRKAPAGAGSARNALAPSLCSPRGVGSRWHRGAGFKSEAPGMGGGEEREAGAKCGAMTAPGPAPTCCSAGAQRLAAFLAWLPGLCALPGGCFTSGGAPLGAEHPPPRGPRGLLGGHELVDPPQRWGLEGAERRRAPAGCLCLAATTKNTVAMPRGFNAPRF